MTDEELKRIEALHAATTPGEWDYQWQAGDNWTVCGWNPTDEFYGVFEGEQSCDNAHFTAVAHSVVPALIAEVRRLRAALGEAIEWAEDGWAYDEVAYFRVKNGVDAALDALKEALGK